MYRNDIDPVDDVMFPTVVAYDYKIDTCDHFPDNWSVEPTERDQAAIDASLNEGVDLGEDSNTFIDNLEVDTAQSFNVDIGDYRRTAAQRGWGSGWPKCGGASGNLAVVVAQRTGARFSVHRRVARLWAWWVQRAEDVHGYRFKPDSCGAYNCRPIGGTKSPSNHSWGLAADVNWGDNPFTSPLRTDIPQGMVDDANFIGWAWGGHYTGKKDAMHFEFMGSPAQADQITAEVVSGAKLPTSRPLLKKGARGAAVEELQRLLMIDVDGIFGNGTDDAVRRFQRARGLEADGIVGSATWTALDAATAEREQERQRQWRRRRVTLMGE